MTLRSLEIFLSVAKHGKMSEASNELHISQPTISQAISELEKEYGVLLFERLSKKLYITEAGRQLLSYAQNILALTDEMTKSMKNLSDHKTILLGATITVGKCILVDIVSRFEKLYPNIKICVTIDNTLTIEHLLIKSQIDIALVEGTIKNTELIITSAIPDSLVLVAHHKHPLAKRDSVGIKELSSYPFILRENGSGTREIFESKLRKYNVAVDVKWSCYGNDSILEAVLANQGLTVISERLVKPYVDNKELFIIPIRNIKMNRNFSLVHHKTKYMSEALLCLSNFIIPRQ